MFFIGIMGIDQKSKEIKNIHNITCKNCKRLGMYKLVKNYSYFHFFFIPLFRFNVSYNLISRCCNTVFSISKDLGRELEAGKETIDESEIIVMGQLNHFNCHNCGNRISREFIYCPKCGTKVQ